MDLKRFIFVCSLSLLACLTVSSITLAGETINFGMGRMLDSSRSPEIVYEPYHELHPTGLLEVNEKLYAFWQEEYFEDYTSVVEQDVFKFSTSDDYGSTWTSGNKVAMESSYAAAVAVDGDGNIHAVSGWSPFREGRGFDYGVYDTTAGDWSFQSYSTACFVQYSSCCPTPYLPNYNRFSMQYNPADDHMYMMAAYESNGCEGVEVYKIEGGVITEMPPPDLPAGKRVNYAEMCIDSNGLIYLFVGGDDPIQLYLWRSGSGWEGPVATLEKVDAGAICAKAGPDDRVFLAWEHGYNHDTYITSFLDGQPYGPTEPVRVDDNLSRKVADAKHQDIFFGPPDAQGHYDIYVMVYEGRFKAYECYPPDMIYRSTDGGKSFGKGWRITWGDYNSACPVDPKGIVTTDGGGNERIVVFWEDDRIFDPSHQLYYSIGKVYPDNPSVLLVSDDYSETSSEYQLNWRTHDSVTGQSIPEFIEGHNYHNYEAWYADSLFSNNIPYDFYDMAGERRMPELAYLKKFKAVVWETGLEHEDAQVDPGYNTLTDGEQDLLSGYLDWGGKLFLCSQSFMSDARDESGYLNNAFANDYLSVTDAEYIPTGSDYTAAVSGYDVHVSNMQLREYTETPICFFDNISSAALTLQNPGDAQGLYSDGSNIAGLSKCAANYSLVFLGFPFETIDQHAPGTTSATRDEVMGWVMGLLEDSQGYVVSKNSDFSTSDTYFAPGDTMYVAVWSDRVTDDGYRAAYFTLDGGNPVVMSHSATLGGRTLECYIGSVVLNGGQGGDRTISEITLSNNTGDTYTITDRPISVGLGVTVLNPANQEVPFISPYPINLRIRCEGSKTVLVSPYYYDLQDPGTMMPIEGQSSITVNGEANIAVGFDITGLAIGHSYGIYVEAKIKSGNVNSSYYSTGHLDMVDTFDPQYPGYTNIMCAMYGAPDGDTDGDFIQNHDELAMGTDPLDPASHCALAITIDQPTQDAWLTGDIFTISGTASNENDGPAVTKVIVGVAGMDYEAIGTSNWSYDWQLPPGEGNYTVTACAYIGDYTDVHGNAQVQFYVDNVPPSSTINDPQDGTVMETGQTEYLITGNSSYSYSNVQVVQVSTDGGATWDNAESYGGDWYWWKYTWSSPPDGYWNIRSRAIDTLGNIEDPSAGVSVYIGVDKIYRASVDSDGNQSGGAGPDVSVSSDGRYIAFVSGASNLVSGDNNGVADIFVHDRMTGVTERVSLTSSGGECNDFCNSPCISADGSYVVFTSYGDNVVSVDEGPDLNNSEDVFIRDRVNHTTALVSAKADGKPAGSYSWSTLNCISADGRYVVFHSDSGDYDPNDGNQTDDVFVRDLQNGVTTLVSVDDVNGEEGNGDSAEGVISSDGRYVVFKSGAALVPEDVNSTYDIYVRDTQTGTTSRVSLASDGSGANGESWISYGRVITPDGRYVLFASYASNLVANDNNGDVDLFLHDCLTGTTELVSVSQGDPPANYWISGFSMSEDARYVVFSSYADNLVSGDTNGRPDIFVRDRQTGSTMRLNMPDASTQANGDSGAPFITADGRYVAFVSGADNLVPGDTNGQDDVFIVGNKAFFQ